MTLVIDGYNLYFTGMRPGGGEHRLERVRAEVVAALAGYRAGRRIKVVLFFDGGPRGEHLPRVQREQGIEVRFSAASGDADREIIAMVAHAPNPGELRVVSSDAAIRQAARRGGAQVVSAEEFARELRRKGEGGAPPPDEPAVKYVPPGQAEVDYWLRVFTRKKRDKDDPG